MYKPIHFLILNRKLSFGKTFIKNIDLPICSNCLHFIKNTNQHDPILNSEQYGRCKKFGEMNVITGVIEYDIAKKCRSNNIKCGNTGLEYIEKPQT